MKLAIVHYHLDHGGVARVVADQLVGLGLCGSSGAPDQVVVCHGGGRRGLPDDLRDGLGRVDLRFLEIEGLDYDEGLDVDPGRLARRLMDALDGAGFGVDETIVHVHNHSIGKNISLPGAVRILAERGYRLLLQVHDFAEDLRPHNYHRLNRAARCATDAALPDWLYPQAPHVHYAVLNDRDRAVLIGAGVAQDRLHLLPNAVADRSGRGDRQRVRATLGAHCGVDPDRKYVLYPVRGIRRKNLGEAMLWAALFRSSITVGVTLPPADGCERSAYDRWRRLSAALDLPMAFETGCTDVVSLGDNFLAADRVMTTSLAEGFGMAFLEGYLAGRPLVGRKLPEITADFERHGISLPGLRDRVEVPADWIGCERLTDMFERTYNATLQCYARPPLARNDVADRVAAKVASGFVDFGDLDAAAQTQVLTLVAEDRRRATSLLDANLWMSDAIHGADGPCGEEVPANVHAITTSYSRRGAGSRLAHVYQRLMDAAPSATFTPLTAGDAILDGFLRFDRFRPVLV